MLFGVFGGFLFHANLQFDGDKRSEVHRRLFQVLWYGNSVGKVNSSSTAIPPYVFPIEIRTVIREHFPDVNAGKHDDAVLASSANVHTVTWNDFAAATWPKPPKGAKCAKPMPKNHIN